MFPKSAVLLFLAVLLVYPFEAQVRRGQEYTEWSPLVHLPAPINSEWDDHAADADGVAQQVGCRVAKVGA